MRGVSGDQINVCAGYRRGVYPRVMTGDGVAGRDSSVNTLRGHPSRLMNSIPGHVSKQNGSLMVTLSRIVKFDKRNKRKFGLVALYMAGSQPFTREILKSKLPFVCLSNSSVRNFFICSYNSGVNNQQPERAPVSSARSHLRFR